MSGAVSTHLSAVANFGFLAIRCMIGFVMLAHGYNHIFGGGKIKGTAGWFASLGMKPGILHAWTASLTELAVGIMLILGIGTPLAATGTIGIMLVALITNHLKNGFFIFRPGEGYEYVLTIIVVALGIGCVGAGNWSLDHAFGWFASNSTLNLILTVAPGVLGAAGLLVTFWRPEKKQ
jgi:putative oxidoreductase